MYIIIALVKVKTSKYLSKTNEVWNKARGWKKKHTQFLRFFWYRNICDDGNMVVGEIPEFFQFPRRDICISTARCKCTIYIFTYKSIKVIIRTEFINMIVLLSMLAFLYCSIRNVCITMSEIELVFRWPGRRCSGSLFSMLLFKKLYLMQVFNQYL